MNRCDVVRAELPEEFLRTLFEKMRQAYRATGDLLNSLLDGQHHGEEQRDLRPFLRRALIEGVLAERAMAYGFQATAVDSGGFFHHRKIESGSVVITQSSKSGLSRASDYKRAYAEQYHSLLFDDEQIEAATAPTPGQTSVYAVLVHARSADDPNELGYAVLRFPKPGYNGWYPEVFDFVTECSSQAPTPVSSDVEVIPDTAFPDLLNEEGLG